MKSILVTAFVFLFSTSAFADVCHHYKKHFVPKCEYVWGAHFCTSPPRPCTNIWGHCI